MSNRMVLIAGGDVGAYFPGQGTLSEENFTRGLTLGRIDERASCVLLVLRHRHIGIAAETRERILTCPNLLALDRLLERAFSVTDEAELFSTDGEADHEREQGQDRDELLSAYYHERGSYRPVRSGLITFAPGSMAEHSFLRGMRAGKVEERAVNILSVLEVRGVPTLARTREQITTCTDLRVLGNWLTLAFGVRDAKDLFATEMA